MDRQAAAVQSFGSTEAHNALVGNQFSGQTIITFQGRFDQSQKIEAEWKRLEREENERNDCLRSLAFREINARRHDILPAHPETCDWLFDTLEFRQWMDPACLKDHNGVFWIKGKPGAGKSTLMKHAFQYFQQPAVLSDYLLISYFFNARGETLEKTPLGLLRSIVHQILLTDSAMYKHFRPFYLTASVNKEWQWRQSELQEFIRWALTQQHLSKPFLLFIDALDECNESDVRDVVKFLELLSTYASRANVLLKICLSSRHYPSITMYRVVELTVENSGDHKGDISRYIDDTLRVSDADMKSEIRRKADGIFLWVVIAVSLLNKAYDEGQVEAMRTTLEKVPADLEKMFSAILRKDMSNAAETVRMLQWVLFSLRPLTPQELFAAVVGIALPADDLIRRRITNSSKGLIEIRKGNADSEQSTDTLQGLADAQEENTDSVQFIHLSVRDFLFRYKRLQILDANLGSEPFATIHGRLWDRCWSSIQEAVTTSTYEEQVNERGDKDPFLKYAASHILEHAEKALSNDATMKRGADCGGAQERPSGATRRTSIQNWLRESDVWFPRLKLSEGEMGTSLVYTLAILKLPNLVRALPEGTDVNKRGGWYGNALQAASQGGDLEIVELLLEKGADVNAKGGIHGSALQAALTSGRLEIARLLLQHGADASAQGNRHDGHFRNALQTASWTGRVEVVKLLLGNGADVNIQGGIYGNALQAASSARQLKVVKVLLEHGADVNKQGGYYCNALVAASFEGQLEIVQLLLKHGADVNAQGGYYGNALQTASWAGRLEVVRLLLQNGAEINAEGGRYGDALQAALWGGHLSIVELLIDNGANVFSRGSHNHGEL